ncbi:gp16 family protein [Yersinia bercovieri]|uniref:gp16 family protein n=1 Tax=Yersinia bercovieri TaxID=634 RepID=UPI00005F7991|nr:regulatory protein GemA [Yersinia bercovieri]QKJ05487.1 regulatory protein GemA [Yersinia bercovieri ATCC 43970]
MDKKLIQLIHVGKSALAWDDETYRDVIYRLTGKTSSAHCSIEQQERIVAYMRAHGFEPKPTPKRGRRPSVPASKKTILSKIEALLADANRPWDYAESMAQHMFQVRYVDWLPLDQLTKLMQALIIDAKRRGKL